MKIAQVGGISIRLNNFFLVLLFFLALAGRLAETLFLFALVTLHEFAHVLTALSFGQKVSEIELLPFGGVARLEDNIEIDPQAEWWVALAGPTTNLFLILIGYGMRHYGAFPEEWWDYFLQGNAMLAGFNLLPALPLDGGRIYRAYLARKMGFRRATIRAGMTGKVVAVLLAAAGGVGIYLGHTNYTLPILSVFIYLSAGKEMDTAAYVYVRYLTRKKQELNESGVIPAEQLAARFDRPVKDVVKFFVPKKFHIILVLDEDGAVKGMTTELDVIQALFDRGIETPVGEVIRRDM